MIIKVFVASVALLMALYKYVYDYDYDYVCTRQNAMFARSLEM